MRGQGGAPRVQWLGRLGYRWAWRLQHLRRDAVIAGVAPEVLWMLEHGPVVTTGRRPVERLPEHVEVVHTERGGLATWHGPGQLVGYLILDVGRRDLTVRGTVCGLEQAIIGWLATRGIDARRRPGAPGVWVGRDKIAAVGLHFRRGVSMHGFALNLTADLRAFDAIVPCGIRDGGVTSVLRVCGISPSPREVAEEVGRAVVDTLTPDG